jgi:hypothetical protein
MVVVSDLSSAHCGYSSEFRRAHRPPRPQRAVPDVADRKRGPAEPNAHRRGGGQPAIVGAVRGGGRERETVARATGGLEGSGVAAAHSGQRRRVIAGRILRLALLVKGGAGERRADCDRRAVEKIAPGALAVHDRHLSGPLAGVLSTPRFH